MVITADWHASTNWEALWVLHAHYYKSCATTKCAVEVREGHVIIFVDFAIVTCMCVTHNINNLVIFSDIAKYVLW